MPKGYKQHIQKRQIFDAFDKDAPKKAALGEQAITIIVSAGEGIKSADYVPGVSGWVLPPNGGLKLGKTGGVFPPGSVGFTDIQDINTAKILGRSTAGMGEIEELTIGASLVLSSGSLKRAALSGDVSAPENSNTTTLATVNASPGSFGGAAKTLTATVNGKGLITALAETAIAIVSTAVTDFVAAAKSAIGIYRTDTVALTAQTADIADTNFVNVGTTAGLYRITYYLLDTTADLAAGAVTLNIKFTDNAAARTVSSSAVPLTATSGFAQGSIIARLNSGHISYGVTHTGLFGTADYALYVTAERIA